MMKLIFGNETKKSSNKKGKSNTRYANKSKSKSRKSLSKNKNKKSSSNNAINTTLLRSARSKSSEVQRSNKFVSNSRLNRTQRKYCGCVMDVRTNLSKRKNMSLSRSKGKRNSGSKSNNLNNNPYAICYSSIRKGNNMHTNKKKREEFKKSINPGKTNCVMNYDFDAYSLRQIQDLAKERDIPTSFKRKSDGKLTPYKKSTLASMITKSYFVKRSKKNQTKKLKLPVKKVNRKRKNVTKKVNSVKRVKRVKKVNSVKKSAKNIKKSKK